MITIGLLGYLGYGLYENKQELERVRAENETQQQIARQEAEERRRAEEQVEAERRARLEATAREAEAARNAQQEAEARRIAQEQAEAEKRARQEAAAREAEARRIPQREAEAQRRSQAIEAESIAQEQAAAQRKAKAEAETQPRGHELRRGVIGVQLQDLTPELARAFHVPPTGGAVVVSVVPDSEADRAGLRAGDVVVAVDGKDVHRASDVRNQIGLLRAGETVIFGVLREGTPKAIPTKVGERLSRQIQR